jgi:hypothetical protein
MRIRLRRTRYENSGPECKLLPFEEKAQVKRNTSKTCFTNAQHSAQRNKHGIRRSDGLKRRHETPGQDYHGHENVRRNDLPQQRHPFKGNVSDVESRQSPLVPFVTGRVGLKIFIHASYSSIADIYILSSVFVSIWKGYSIRTRPVHKAQHIEQSDEQNKFTVKLPPNRLFFIWSI